MSESPFHGIFSAFSANQAEQVQKVTKTPDVSPAPSSTNKQRAVPGQIAVDIFEHEDYYIIRAPIAGVKLSDLDIEAEGKTLTIRGTRTEPEQVAAEQFFLKECYWGEFHRTISLPIAIDAKKVKATFSKDSVLKVYVPKGEEKIKIVRIGEA
jgi:HSP20 family molecular chaperone IbpA